MYSENEKMYSENEKMYSENKKMYTENKKMYSENEKMYSENKRKKCTVRIRRKHDRQMIHSIFAFAFRLCYIIQHPTNIFPYLIFKLLSYLSTLPSLSLPFLSLLYTLTLTLSFLSLTSSLPPTYYLSPIVCLHYYLLSTTGRPR